MWRFILLLAFASVPVSNRAGSACRCPQLTVDRYFDQADLVVVGLVRTAVRLPGRIEVTVTPEFRPGPFKGVLAGVTLATPLGTASCGMDVVAGRVYVIFASRSDPAEPKLAWFDTCSGSRLYAGGPDVYASPFPELPHHRVIPRLFELAGAPPGDQGAGPASPFHTSPACWSRPRIHHVGMPAREYRERIRVSRDATARVDTGGVRSPNGAYTAWWPAPSDATTGGATATVLIDDERAAPIRISIDGAIAPPAIQWMSEKLLFLRVVWSRALFTDLVFDVELGRPIYEDMARYGDDAWQQYQAACLGQCPCLPVPGSADSLPRAPRHQPLPGEQEGLRAISAGNLAYLDQDWDGRVFSAAAGARFTVSALKGATGREEYPVQVNAVREVDNAYWVDVSIYRVSPCADVHAVPVHRGWVPAFSARGRLVLGTWGGGC